MHRLQSGRGPGALLAPALISLLLFVHSMLIAQVTNGTLARRHEYDDLPAACGELAMAVLLAVLAVVEAAALLDQQPIPRLEPLHGVTGALGLALAAGLATASLYTVTAAVFFAQPATGPLRWAVLLILPTSLWACAVAAVAWHRGVLPACVAAFPASSMIAAAAGVVAITVGSQAGFASQNGWGSGVTYGGGALVGAGIAFALVRHPSGRFAFAVLLGLLAVLVSQSDPIILVAVYAVAVAVWWIRRAWTCGRAARTSSEDS